MNWFTQKRVAAGLAVLLVIGYFGPATGLTTFFYRDFGVLGYPTASYHREMFWRGELPLWNPYSNCGVPFLAQWGTMVLYPFTLLYLLLPFPWSLNFFCLGHLWWGAVGAFSLAKRWTKSSEGAALAAILFLFNGITLSSLSWPNYTVAFAWMPWLVLFASDPSRSRAEIARAAAVGAMQMLSGAPEVILLTWALVGGIWVAELLRTGRTSSAYQSGAETPHSRTSRNSDDASYNSPASWSAASLRRFGILPMLIVLIASLCAAQLLPFFQLLSLSQRQAGALGTKWGLPPFGIANFILPMLHAFQTPQGTWFQFNQHFLSSTYLGPTALLLAAIGVFTRDTKARLLAGASIVCVFFAVFGFWQSLPLVGLARYPVKFVLLLPLTISILAAFGLKRVQQMAPKAYFGATAGLLVICVGLIFWTRNNPYRFDRWPEAFANSTGHLAVFVVAAVLISSWRRIGKPSYIALLCGLLFLSGRFHIQNQNPETKMATLRSAVGTRPLPKLGEGRVFISREAEEALLNSEVRDLDADFIGKQLAVWSHLNLVELVPKVNGSATLQLREQKIFQDSLYSGTNSNLEAWLDILSVTHITAPGKVVDWTNRTTALPFVRSVPAGKAKTIRVKENEIEVAMEGSASLEIPQSWHPAWRAEVLETKTELPITHEGEAPVMRISIPESGTVRLCYRDRLFLLGLGISLLSLGICLAVALSPPGARRAEAKGA